MNDNMTTTLNAAAPVTDSSLDSIDFAGADTELLESILTTPHTAADGLAPRQARRNARRLVTAVAIAATAVLSVGVVTWVASDSANPEYAAAAIRVAESNDRLLVDRPAWEATRADLASVENGEVTFSDGDRWLTIHWYPPDQHQSYLDDRRNAGDATSTNFLGRPATTVKSRGTNPGHGTFTTIVSPSRSNFIEIRGDRFEDERSYRTVLESLRSVSVKDWLSAMPPSVVQPNARRDAVRAMLTGIPLPAGFDSDALENGDLVSDRYQLGARVSGAAFCAWFDRWFDAIANGDAAAQQEAQDAFASTHRWPVLSAMNAEGDFPEAVWSYADLATGTRTPEELGLASSREELLTREELTNGLGCQF